MGFSLHGFPAGGATAAARLALVVLTAIGVAGCAGRGGPVPYDVPNFGVPDPAQLAVPPSQQRIAALDLLNVAVFQVPELSGQFRVDAEGRVNFPLIGAIDAAGKLPPELAQQMAQQLGARYLRSPDVRVTIAEQAQQQLTIEGSVRDPGVVAIRGTTTLMRAIALVHGLSNDANPRQVVVFRTVNGQRQAAAFDLHAIRRSEAPDPEIFGNDIIVVNGSRARRFLQYVLTAIPALGVFTPLAR